jgi:hypothetical protein
MKEAWIKRCLPIIGMLVAACSDPTEPPAVPDPCASVYACRSPGTDLEILSVVVTSDAADPQTMLPIVQPGALRVNYAIRNRGRTVTPAGSVWLNLVSAGEDYYSPTMHQAHPALAPGEMHSGSALLTIGSIQGHRIRDDRMTVQAEVWTVDDTFVSNNEMSSALFHLAVPLLDVDFAATPVAIIGQPVALAVVVRNYGRHADVPAQTMTGCLYDGFRGCSPEYRTTTGGLQIPHVAAGTAVQFNTTLSVPPSAAWQDAAADYQMHLCVGQPMAYAVDESLVCSISPGRNVVVRPDYESVCAPPVLVPGQQLTLSAYNCGLRPSMAGFEAETRAYRFHITSLQAESGVTYALQRSDTTSLVRLYDAQGNHVRDLDPAPDRIRVDVAQRLYLVMYSATESIAITAPRVAEDAS